jgi:hypothetical protein
MAGVARLWNSISAMRGISRVRRGKARRRPAHVSRRRDEGRHPPMTPFPRAAVATIEGVIDHVFALGCLGA